MMTELLIAMFGGLFITTADPKYNDAMKLTIKANYENSQIKQYVNKITQKINKDQPIATYAVGISYAALVKKEFRFKTVKLLNNIETTGIANRDSGKIEFKFSF